MHRANKGNRRPGNRGNAMVEFAIGVTILTTLFGGTFQYGYTFYRYNTLLGAVNAGARYAAMRPYDSASSTPTTRFSSAVKNMVVYGNPNGGTTPVVPGLSTSNVTLQVEFGLNVPKRVTVSITGYSFPAVFGTTTLTGKPKVRYPYQGIFAPTGSL